MIPLNVVYPFFYLMDIVKDIVQFLLLLVAVGGLPLVLKNWSSFSSTVTKNIYSLTLFNITFYAPGCIWCKTALILKYVGFWNLVDGRPFTCDQQHNAIPAHKSPTLYLDRSSMVLTTILSIKSSLTISNHSSSWIYYVGYMVHFVCNCFSYHCYRNNQKKKWFLFST